MKKKIIISVVAVVICAAAFVAVILIKNNTKQAVTETFKSSSEILSAGEVEKKDTAAGFAFRYTDRLGGYQATDIKNTGSAIEVTYDSAGFVRKTNIAAESGGSETKNDTSNDETGYSESSKQVIDGMNVTFEGKDGKVYRATWRANNYDYTISVNDGVFSEDMTEYVKATR